MLTLGLILFAYLLGSIPSGLLWAKAFRLEDPRTIGSGNIGASNLTRLGGKRLGFLTLAADALKGIIPTYLALILLPDSPSAAFVVAATTVVGHCFSAFLRLRGGKGIATAAGTLLLFAPIDLGIVMITWLLVYWRTRITSLAGIAGVVVLPISLALRQQGLPLIAYAIFVGALILWRLRSNIEALKQGTERSFH